MYVETDEKFQPMLIGSKHLGVRMVRLISLLNDGLLPLCACLFPSTMWFDPGSGCFISFKVYFDISNIIVWFRQNQLEQKKQQKK